MEINLEIRQEYKRLRAKGIRASSALLAAKSNIAFEYLAKRGLVKFEVVPEIDFYDDSFIDAMKAPEQQKERLRKKINARIEREGHWIIVSYYRSSTNEPWIPSDSVGGFIGKDFVDSGYDSNIKQSAVNNYYNSVLLDAFGPLGIINEVSKEYKIELTVNQKFAIMSEFIKQNSNSLFNFQSFVKKTILSIR